LEHPTLLCISFRKLFGWVRAPFFLGWTVPDFLWGGCSLSSILANSIFEVGRHPPRPLILGAVRVALQPLLRRSPWNRSSNQYIYSFLDGLDRSTYATRHKLANFKLHPAVGGVRDPDFPWMGAPPPCSVLAFVNTLGWSCDMAS